MKIFTHSWYAREAEAAARFYASIFPDSRVDRFIAAAQRVAKRTPGLRSPSWHHTRYEKLSGLLPQERLGRLAPKSPLPYYALPDEPCRLFESWIEVALLDAIDSPGRMFRVQRG